MKHGNRLTAWILSLCLLLCGAPAAFASQTSDFEALAPLMDLVVTAAMGTGEAFETVGDETTTLSASFINAFFSRGPSADASLGLTEDMLSDPARQKTVLSAIFAAQLPELTAIEPVAALNGYIGFRPVTVNAGSDSGVQIIGEIYWAEKAMGQLSEADFVDVSWIDRAVFSFRTDESALNGYRLTGFSIGSELNMEEAMQNYFEKILMEYVNTSLGFEVQYPSVFADNLLVEDADGISAKLPDGNASFLAKRIANDAHANLKDYVDGIASGLTGAKTTVNEEFNYATLSYNTADGYTAFAVYIVTDKYVYQAELTYRQSLAATYAMYAVYLENSFLVYEVSVG